MKWKVERRGKELMRCEVCGGRGLEWSAVVRLGTEVGVDPGCTACSDIGIGRRGVTELGVALDERDNSDEVFGGK